MLAPEVRITRQPGPTAVIRAKCAIWASLLRPSIAVLKVIAAASGFDDSASSPQEVRISLVEPHLYCEWQV